MNKPRISTLKPSIQTASVSKAKTLTVSNTQRTRGSKWMEIRNRIFRRDNGLCQECKREGRLKLASVIDHIKPLWAGGKDDDANLQSLCKPCHDAKSAKEAADRAAGVVPL